ncbi:MAG: hypothetical protein AAFY20_21070 [Cyanobacteria bacterium J06639_14]
MDSPVNIPGVVQTNAIALTIKRYATFINTFFGPGGITKQLSALLSH